MSNSLLTSRRFWLTVADVIVSTVVYFVGQHGTPALAADIKWLVVSWQPVVVLLIVAYTVDDTTQAHLDAKYPASKQ